MSGFCLVVELHREGSALQPTQKACFEKCTQKTLTIPSLFFIVIGTQFGKAFRGKNSMHLNIFVNIKIYETETIMHNKLQIMALPL